MNQTSTLKRWTPNEVQILTENIDKILEESGGNGCLKSSTPTLESLAALFSRTVPAVHHKCRILAVQHGKMQTKSALVARKADLPVSTESVDANAILRQIYGKVSFDDYVEVSNALNRKS